MSAGTHPNFPIAITPAESAAGFVLIRVQNPSGEPGHVPELYAAVRPVSPTNRVLKVRSPEGVIGYVLRQRDPGMIHSSTGELMWRSTSAPIPDFNHAIEMARNAAESSGTPLKS